MQEEDNPVTGIEKTPGYKRKRFWSQFTIKYKTFLSDWFGDTWLYRKVNKSLRWLYKFLFQNSELWHKSKLAYIFIVIDVLLAVAAYIALFIYFNQSNTTLQGILFYSLISVPLLMVLLLSFPFVILDYLRDFICYTLLKIKDSEENDYIIDSINVFVSIILAIILFLCLKS